MPQKHHFGAEVLRAEIDGVTTKAAVVAAVSGMEIEAVDGQLTVAVAGTVAFESDSTGLNGTQTLAAGVPLALGGLKTAAGEALNLTASQSASGWVEYVLRKPKTSFD